MLTIGSIFIPSDQLEFQAIHSSGPGGQNVNKVATAIQLRFDITGSSLPDTCKQRLLAQNDQRISNEGVIVIKAQNHRSQQQNRQEALDRLAEMITKALRVPRKRVATRPKKSAIEKRLQEKKLKGRLKRLRSPMPDSDH